VVKKITKQTNEDIKLLREAKENYRDLLLDKQYVTGIGIGRRTRQGKYEDEFVIKVYVKKKLPKYRIAKEDFIMPYLEFENKRFPTDVEESGIPEAQLFTLRSRPLIGGSSIGVELAPGGGLTTLVPYYRNFAGTLGVCVTLDDHNTYILSNNHVLALCDKLAFGTPVYQPSLIDKGVKATDQVATLSKAIPIDFTYQNDVDCALALVGDSFNGANREIHWVGYPQTYLPAPEFLTDPYHPPSVHAAGAAAGAARAGVDSLKFFTGYPYGLTLWKMGRTTEATIGVCTGIHEDFKCDYSNIFGNPRGTNKALFVDQLRIKPIDPTPFSGPGDSGSLVLDYFTNQPIGLLFSAVPDGSYSFCNLIDNVLNKLGIQHI